MSLGLRTTSPTGQVCSLFLCRLPMSELDSPVLEPDLNLMFRKSKVQRQMISFTSVQVVVKLKATFQRHALVIGEHRTGPG